MALEINRNSIFYRLIELLGEDLLSVSVDSRSRVHLPNLRCRDLTLSLGGDQLRVSVTVDNIGLARAGSCDVVAHVQLNTVPPQNHMLQARCPILDVGSSHRLDLGTVPNVLKGLFANVSVTVDPPTAVHPGGEVWESDKTDNMCFNGIYTTPIEPREPPSEVGEPTKPLDPPIHK
jgi:hypothetical protein